MRVRRDGACARFTLILCLLVVTVTTSGRLPTVIGSFAPGAAVTGAAKTKPADAGKAQRSQRGKDRPGKHQGRKGHHKRGPVALDAVRIAAAKADSVADLQCGNLIATQVGDRVYCTHGEDPPEAAPGATVAGDVGIESAAPTGSLPGPLCIDDGTSGPRLQIVYVHRNDRADRLPDLLPRFRRLASEMDLIFDQSARKTGGSLRIRFVTDADCQVDIADLAASESTIEGWGPLLRKMEEAGYNDIDRKYLMLVDSNVFCGIGSFTNADDPDTEAHDFTGYARVDTPCWDAGTMAHEISHTMGAVQYSAPHTSRGGHCIDEWDVMCYSDEPYHPQMQTLCPDGAQDFRLDCGNDDYYAARPAPGSYLAKHWNMADSMYLTLGTGPTCVDAKFEPDDAYWYDFWHAPMREFELGTSEPHAFCQEPGDTDWALFEGKAGTSYVIETSNLAPGVDTQLTLYRGFKEQHWRGMDEVATSDDRTEGDPSSAIAFTAPSDGSYLVGVAEANEQAGFDKTYTLTIREAEPGSDAVLSLSRTKAKPGQSFGVTVADVDPTAVVTLWWRRGGQVSKLGETTAGDDGVAKATYSVPKGAPRGDYRVEATADDGSAAAAGLHVLDAGKKQHKQKNTHHGKGGKHKGHKHKHGRGRS